MEGQAVTTNPLLIMAINMSIVFFVLIALGILMKIVYLIDPTKKKKEAPKTDTTVAAPAAPARWRRPPPPHRPPAPPPPR